MSRQFGTNINLLGFSLIAAMMHPVASDPTGLGTGDAGRLWFNTTSNKLMVWNGTAAIDFLARANHTGSQTASTISDFATAVQAFRLDQLAAAGADVSLGSHKLTNVTDPSSAQDAATKNYIDSALASLASGQVLKGAVKCAATTNISLTTPGATIDGVTMVANDIVLLTGQTTGSQNGPYVWNGASSTMTRALNWDTSAEAVLGSYWIVEQGTNADTFALLTNDTALTLGTTVPAFVFRGSAGATYTGSSSILVSGGVISAILASASGLVSASGLGIDTTVVARKVTGPVPATSSGIFTVSGANVTVNHALTNSAPSVTVRCGATPPSGGTTGAVIEVDSVVSDANNVVITFPAAPATGNYIISIIG
jgi:hypothetical protein